LLFQSCRVEIVLARLSVAHGWLPGACLLHLLPQSTQQGMYAFDASFVDLPCPLAR